MPRTLAWQALVMHAKVAILLTSLFSVFKISFLPKDRVNYYDYIIKWCFGVWCNWCVSLDISQLSFNDGLCFARLFHDAIILSKLNGMFNDYTEFAFQMTYNFDILWVTVFVFSRGRVIWSLKTSQFQHWRCSKASSRGKVTECVFGCHFEPEPDRGAIFVYRLPDSL